MLHPKFAEERLRLRHLRARSATRRRPTAAASSRFTVKDRDQAGGRSRSRRRSSSSGPPAGTTAAASASARTAISTSPPATAAASPTASQTGQDLGDLLGAILRIDVDKTDGGKSYAIPKDNPFVNTKGAAAEIWAYGLRQAWKFSFDPRPATCGPARSARTCGRWSTGSRRAATTAGACRRATHPFRPERKKGPTPILKPIVEHHHAEFRSITGGFVYHGKRLPELKGAYIYGDYDTGRVWMLRYDAKAKKVTEHRELADTHAAHRRLGRRTTTARSTRSTSSAAASTSSCRPRRRPPTRRSSRAS